jgi:hypothetical protein
MGPSRLGMNTLLHRWRGRRLWRVGLLLRILLRRREVGVGEVRLDGIVGVDGWSWKV